MSSRRTTRRKLLAGLGTASAVGLAGCQGVIPGGSTTESPGQNGTGSSPGTGKETETPGRSGGKDPSKTYMTDVIENFENVSGWKAVQGNVRQANAPSGKALRITGSPQAGNRLWVRKTGLDWNLKNKNVSFALNIDKPELGQKVIVTMRLHAPDADNTMTVGEYVRVLPSQGWFRIDAGPRSIGGLPKLGNVTGVDIMVQPPQGGQTDVRIGDVRAVDSFDKGYVALTFDDGLASQYEAHKVLKKHDVPGTMSVITGEVGQKGHLDKSQLTEMQSAGWDFAAHSSGTTPVTEMTTSALWQNVIDCHDWMTDNGFEQKDGQKSFVYPKGRWDDEAIQYLQMENYFNTGYRYVSHAGALTGPVTDPWTVARGDGSVGIDYLRPKMNVAAMFNQLMILTFHGVGTGGSMSVPKNELEQIVTYGKDREMEFITLADVDANMTAKMG